MGDEKNYEILPKSCQIKQPDTRDYSIKRIEKIKRDVTERIGQYALYYRQEKRSTIPILVKIEGVYPHFVRLSYECYAPDGKFRQYLYDCVNWTTLYCGDEALKFMDDDI